VIERASKAHHLAKLMTPMQQVEFACWPIFGGLVVIPSFITAILRPRIIAAAAIYGHRFFAAETGERPVGAAARTILLLQLAAQASCAQLTGYHPQEWYDARAACRQEMNERIPRSEPPDVRGAYVEQCMAARGYEM
jgi:hypothetical protein